MIRAGPSRSARRPGSGVRLGLAKASHATGLEVITLLKKFDALEALEDVALGSG